MIRITGLRVVCGALGSLLALTACGSGSRPAAPALTSQPAQRSTQDAPAAVSGTVTDSAGRPLSGASVNVYGYAFASGEDVSVFPVTDAAGRYSIVVPLGNYQVDAYHDVTYNDQTYRFELHPLNEGSSGTYTTDAPVVVDFVWKVSGPRPGTENAPDAGHSYYGGELSFDIVDIRSEGFQSDLFAEQFPQGFSVVTTLTPAGPLVDGSTGQIFTSRHEVATKGDASWNEIDVPVGRYTVSARIERPDGSSHDLQVVGVGPDGAITATAPAPSATFDFAPQTGIGGGVREMVILFVYGPPYDPIT